MIKNVYRYYASTGVTSVPVMLVTLQWKWNYCHGFSKNTEMSSSMKIRQVGAELLRADGQT
jgi:hypothetical protein